MKLKKLIRHGIEFALAEAVLPAIKIRGNKLIILMYHRILPKGDPRAQLEEPGMMVTPESFELHLKYLKENFDIIKLGDWVKAYHNGDIDKLNGKIKVAISFDDGWLDNYQYAFPLLKKYRVPATLFACSDLLGKSSPFWPNQVASILGNGKLSLYPHLAKLIGEQTAQTITPELISETINRLKQYTDEKIYQAIGNSCDSQDDIADIVNTQQLIEMEQSNLVEIGCHTATHKRLIDSLDKPTLNFEIESSKQKLAQICDKEIKLFCFPNGDYSKDALSLAQQSYQGAVTTNRGTVALCDDINIHELPRIGLHDDVSNSLQKLKAKLTGLI